MAKNKSVSTIESGAVDKLSSILEQATRSTKEGVKYFLEPAQGTGLARSTSGTTSFSAGEDPVSPAC